MSIYYAGVPLLKASAAACRWVERQFGSAGLSAPGPPGWPATKLAGLASFGWPAPFRCRLGSLYWPANVSRFAIGHFLASTEQLNALYEAMPAGEAATLTLSTEQGEISTDLSMLPARPLASVPQEDGTVANGLYLLTLVDERYFLWGQWASAAVAADDTTTWAELIAAAATDLGITLTADAVPAGFGSPPSGLDLSGEPAPLVLDALCYAAGLKVVRKLDGSYVAKTADNDRTAIQANLSGLVAVRVSGGPFSLDRNDLTADVDTVDDQPLALPETIRLVVQDSGGLHTVDVLLQDQDPLFETVRPDTVQGWKVAVGTLDEPAAEAYVGALGRAFGIRTIAAVSRRFAGIVPWTPEGVSEAVEWSCRKGEASTIIHPPAWADGLTDLVGIPTDAKAGGFWAVLTAVPDPGNFCPVGYSWTKMVESDADCTAWSDGDPPLEGDATEGGMPAVEADDRLDVPLVTNGLPTRVFLRLAASGDRYTFAYPGPPLCDCNTASWVADGFTVSGPTCYVDFTYADCDGSGNPITVTKRICSTVPFYVGEKSAPGEADTVEVEVPIHPITFTVSACGVTAHYTTKILTLPTGWVAAGTTY